MEKIRNIIVACDYAFFEGGAANVAVQSVIALQKYSGAKVFLFAGNGEPCEELKDSGVFLKLLRLPDLLGNKSKFDAFMKGIYNKNVYTEMKDFLSEFDPDETIVHIHTWTKVLSSAVFEACYDMKFSTYLTVHEYFLACPNGACYNYVKKEICNLNPMSLKCLMCNCDSRNYMQKVWRCFRQNKQNNVIRKFNNLHYIFISEFQQKELLKRMPDVEFKHFIKNPINIGENEKISSENNTEYFFIGRLTTEKGPQLFCEAVTKAGVKGVVIGAGLLEESLKKQYPSIEFMGWMNKEQINERLHSARALIFPSLWFEGSPLTVPEVQAYGIPCIVTNCSSAIDDIMSEENGLIVSPTVEELVSAINRFKEDSFVKNLSNNTYSMFDLSRGSEKQYVHKLMELYKKGESK